MSIYIIAIINFYTQREVSRHDFVTVVLFYLPKSEASHVIRKITNPTWNEETARQRVKNL